MHYCMYKYNILKMVKKDFKKQNHTNLLFYKKIINIKFIEIKKN